MSSGLNVVQLVSTIGTAAAIVAASSAFYFPWSARREARRQVLIESGIQTIVTTAIADIKVDMIARVDKSDETTKAGLTEVRSEVTAVRDSAAATALQLATQFGGNGGGIRQAINEQGNALAGLVGRFEQHVMEKGGS